MLKLLRSLEGRSEGNPHKIADLIVQLANSDEVPLRLILSVDAEKRVHQAEAARASEADKWRHGGGEVVHRRLQSVGLHAQEDEIIGRVDFPDAGKLRPEEHIAMRAGNAKPSRRSCSARPPRMKNVRSRPAWAS
ncbi:MAG TPA: hypothetical protein VH325_19415 [Bryobacteraceae bacterium]|jgi:hypothetical protein|nr:hypothetical protein [Bryobacteraceae bacterium]